MDNKAEVQAPSTLFRGRCEGGSASSVRSWEAGGLREVEGWAEAEGLWSETKEGSPVAGPGLPTHGQAPPWTDGHLLLGAPPSLRQEWGGVGGGLSLGWGVLGLEIGGSGSPFGGSCFSTWTGGASPPCSDWVIRDIDLCNRNTDTPSCCVCGGVAHTWRLSVQGTIAQPEKGGRSLPNGLTTAGRASATGRSVGKAGAAHRPGPERARAQRQQPA